MIRPILMALLLLAGTSSAQPYVAGDGFDRPRQVGSSPVLTRFAMGGGDDGPFVYWSDRQGVLSFDLTGGEEGRRIAEGRGIRELSAGEAGGQPAVAWVDRNLATGVSTHVLRWGEEERVLFEALQAYQLDVLEFGSEPAVLLSRRDADEAVLRIITWSGGDIPVASNPRTIDRYVARTGPDGVVAVAWLEGFTDRSAVGGTVSDWSARFATVSPEGTASEPLMLGPARNLGPESSLAVGFVDGEPAVLWPGADGEVNLSRRDGSITRLGQGSALGIGDGKAFWIQGASVVAAGISGEDESVNVAWSPINITGGDLVSNGDDTFLAWYGPTTAGRYEIYSSDDRSPLQATWQDHLSATMGWSPWGFWEALSGQVLGALFAALMVSMVLSPLLWIASMVAIRAKWSQRTTLTGIATGALLILVVMAVISVRSRLPGDIHLALFGTPLQLLACMAVAALLTWLIRRRSDNEQMIAILGSGWLFLFLSLSGIAFITFQSWVNYWSQVV